MNTILRWISPLLLATVTTAGIRLVTDIASSHPFWNRPAMINLKDFLHAIITCYILDLLFRIYLKSRFYKEKKLNKFGEYSLMTLFLLVAITASTFSAHYFINSSNYLIDFVISWVVAIPLSLFYYTLLRYAQISKEYARQTLQVEKIKSEQLATELNYLKAQYHPHFLFNALNTVYFQIDDENKTAKQTVEQLSDLLRYQLYDVKNEVTIKQEVHFLETYIAFQRLRISERLKLTFTHSLDPDDQNVDDQRIHPLLFLPLLENAFKYVGGEYWICISLTVQNNQIEFTVENAVDDTVRTHTQTSGIGIENLRRRLQLLYPDRHSLIVATTNTSYRITLTIINQHTR